MVWTSLATQGTSGEEWKQLSRKFVWHQTFDLCSSSRDTSWVTEGKAYNLGGTSIGPTGLPEPSNSCGLSTTSWTNTTLSLLLTMRLGLEPASMDKRIKREPCIDQVSARLSSRMLLLNVWASRRVSAEGDLESNWDSKRTAILCFAESGGRLYGGAADGCESEMAEI